MLERLNSLIDQHSYICDKEINIIQNNNKSELLKELEKTRKINNKSSESCLSIMECLKADKPLFNIINKKIGMSQKMILVVPKNFDFDSLVKNVNANSIDAITIKDTKDYFIVISKN